MRTSKDTQPSNSCIDMLLNAHSIEKQNLPKQQLNMDIRGSGQFDIPRPSQATDKNQTRNTNLATGNLIKTVKSQTQEEMKRRKEEVNAYLDNADDMVREYGQGGDVQKIFSKTQS